MTASLFTLNPKIIVRLLLCAVIAGCASTPPAPIVDRSLGSPPRSRASAEAATNVSPGSYRVQRGDTLYSIAFRNGLDYQDLARRNRIAAPYTIYVGQVIELSENGRRSQAPTRAVAAAPKPTSPARTPPPVTSPAPFDNVQSRPPVSAPAPTTRPSVPPGAAAVAPVAVVPTPTPAYSGNLAWRWPADGARVNAFVAGDQTRQGVDIAGKAGDPVRAAADGQVVYSGNGLIGYGELIIVKHSTSLLSAYGHNRRRLVQEGDSVKAGQQIAEMGSTSASRDMLHFEIRRNGKPVDPMAFLPPR